MYAWCQDMPGVSAEDYAELMANLGGAEKEAAGLVVHVAGPVAGGFRLLGAHQFGWADRVCSPRCGPHSARHTVLSLILGLAPGEWRGSRKRRPAASRIRRRDRRPPDPIQPCGRRLGKLGVLDLNQRSSRACPTIRGGRLSCSCR
jgi:hypothetical protein